MISQNRAIQVITLLCLLFINPAFASNESAIKFFVSNNTHEISPQTAYVRLVGHEQTQLQHAVKIVLKNNHLQLQNSGNILGVYQMSSDHDITADNTLYFYIAPTQALSQQKIFSIAKLLAIKFKQETVAVFIPDNNKLGEITVNLGSHEEGIDQTISDLHQKLSGSYSQAFSLYLDKTKVEQVEWLGSKLNINEIKKAFPEDKISSEEGQAFLIYQDGRTEKL
jgi:hypothetical protein